MMRSFGFLVTALVTASSLAPPVASQTVTEQIDRWIETYHEYDRFNGIVLVADRGEVIYERGFGPADLAWGIQQGPEARFRIGSITKQFTATLVLQLREEGRIDLQAPITRYLTWYPAEPGDRITVHHLLTHTSGIPEYFALPAFGQLSLDVDSPEVIARLVADLELDFEPGSHFEYSNSGYLLLGLILEAVTGQPYEDLLDERVLEPLHLENTGYEREGLVVEKLATPYRRIGGVLENAPYIDPDAGFSAAMLYSSVGDLFRWTLALHQGQPFRDAATLDLMLTPNLGEYGYGLQLDSLVVGDRRVAMIAHDGGINGFGSIVRYFPEEGRMVVAADNTQRNVITLANSVTQLLFDLPVDPPRRAIDDQLRAWVEAEGIASATERFRDARRNYRDEYDTSEFLVNRVGYEFLARGDIDAAVGIFELNVESYPDRANTYDSLGEALHAGGDREGAIANYRRSLELNPDNENALRVLHELGVEP